MRLVRRLHEEILETSDVKILESAIENQSALTAKSVVETLRGDAAFTRPASGQFDLVWAKDVRLVIVIKPNSEIIKINGDRLRLYRSRLYT